MLIEQIKAIGYEKLKDALENGAADGDLDFLSLFEIVEETEKNLGHGLQNSKNSV